MKSVVTLATLLLVTGCATQPLIQETAETKSPEPTTTVLPYVQECADLAEYARSVAMFRDANIGLNEINYILVNPPPLPVEAIQRDVYFKVGENPLETSIAIYQECAETGYNTIMTRYNKEQAKYRQGLEDAARLKIEQRKQAEAVAAELARIKAQRLEEAKKDPSYRDKNGEPIYIEKE